MTAADVSSSQPFARAALLAALLTLLTPIAIAAGVPEVVGSGVARTETRNLSGFHGLALSIDARLELNQDGSEGLTITGDDNIVPLVETVVEDGTLNIRWKRGIGSTSYNDIAIVVHAKSVEALAIAGSGEIRAKTLKAGNLRLSLAGSGRAAMDALNADSANVSIEGSGSIAAAGRIGLLDASIAGSGRLSAAKLESQKARIAVAGSGRATVWTVQALDASVLGSGTVRYYGNPRVHSAVAGSGTVRQLVDRQG